MRARAGAGVSPGRVGSPGTRRTCGFGGTARAALIDVRNEPGDLSTEHVPERERGTFELEISGRTDRGLVREENEDHFLVAEMWRVFTIEQTSLPGGLHRHGGTDRLGYLLAIADGMGGHAAGELASRTALETIEANVLSELTTSDDLGFVLQGLVRRCEKQLKGLVSGGDEAGRPPGTTLTLAMVIGQRVYITHVGDSRAYLVRNRRTMQITSDHTLGEWLRREGLGDAGAGGRFEGVLVNAVGGGSDRAIIDTTAFDIVHGDTLVLCTDGLTRSVTDQELAEVASDSASASESCDRLLAMALERDGRDNITVIVATLTD